MRRFLAYAVLLLSPLPVGCTYSRSQAEDADLARRKLWTREVSKNVVHASITPGGVINAVVAESNGESASGERWFIQVATGRVLWKGSVASRLVSDLPLPVVAEQRGNQAIVTAVDPSSGAPRWTRNVPGFALLGRTRSQQDFVVLLTSAADPASAPEAEQTMTLTALRAGDGATISSIPIGIARVGASGASAVEFTGDIAVVVCGDLLTSFDLVHGTVLFSSRMNWPRIGERPLPTGIVWETLPDGNLVVAAGAGVVAVRADGLPAWKAALTVPGYVHDLLSYKGSVVVGYRHPETFDSGIAVFSPAGALAVHPGAPRSEEESFVNGVALYGSRAVWISRGHLAQVDLESGRQQLSPVIEGDLVRHAPASLLPRTHHVDLLSMYGVQAISYETGKLLWKVDDLAPPQAVQRGISAAGAAEATPSDATWETASGAFGGELSAAGGGSGFWLAGAMTKGLVLVRDGTPQRYASFVHAMDAGKLIRGVEANLALVDLDSGERREYPLVAGNAACAVGALLHEPTMVAFEALEAVGLACSRGDEIHGIRVSSP